MAIDVETKDTTALGDAELATLGDICADGPASFDIGLLSKQREEWVLITQARNNGVLQGFSFCTLERIGGTPSVLIGMASIKRTAKRQETLKAMMGDQLRRAVLAFPDEDVLVGTRFLDPSGFAGQPPSHPPGSLSAWLLLRRASRPRSTSPFPPPKSARS